MQNQLLAILPMVLIFVVFYFLLIRPQNKKQKQHAKMLSMLKKGDKVVTIGGLHGSIVDLTEERVTLKVNNSTRLVFERSAISSAKLTNVEMDDVKGKIDAPKEEKVEQTAQQQEDQVDNVDANAKEPAEQKS